MSANQPWKAKYPARIRSEVDIPDHPLQQFLFDSAARVPENPAMSFYGQKWTYAQLEAQVKVFASALQRQGVRKGDRVALVLPNCPHFVIAYFGIVTAGAIVVQINPMLVERELQYILADSGAVAAVVLDALYPRVKAVQAQTSVKTIIACSLGGESKPPEEPDMTFTAWMQSGTGIAPEPVEIRPAEDVAVLQYTGGTTGRSKGAMLTHRNLVANAVQSVEFAKDKIEYGKERYLAVIPMFHVYGMTCCLTIPVYQGGCIVMLPRFDVNELLETVKREKPTHFPGVPTMYIALLNHAEPGLFDGLKLCNSGSAPMPVELLREFERKTGSIITEGYGLSEASPVTHSNPYFAERKPGSIGIGLPSVDYKIVDLETGTRELPPNTVGELVVRGPNVMVGYWNMPEETASALRDGWLYTGDIAKMDEEGYVYIIDRKKDLIIASGYNVYPRDVEEVLYEHPAVMEAVVIGVKDAYRGETVKAFVVLRPGQEATEEEIIRHCRANLAPYKVPTIVEFRKELPKSSVGKILRRALREEEASNLQTGS